MIQDDKIIKEFSQRMASYKEEPKAEIWEKIQKNLSINKANPKKFPYKKAAFIVLGVVVLAVGVRIFAFDNSKNTNIQSDNNTLATNNNVMENRLHKTVQQSIVENIEPKQEVVKGNKQAVDNAIKSKTDNVNNVNNILDKSNNEIVESSTTNNTTNKVVNTNSTNITSFIASTANQTLSNTKAHNNQVNLISNQENREENKAATENTNKGKEENNIEVEKNKLYIPNAFQPNSSDENINTFKPKYKEVLEYEMQIFSRSGGRLFTSKDISYGWDGKIKGSLADRGTYIYYIKYKDVNGKTHTQKGTLYLSR